MITPLARIALVAVLSAFACRFVHAESRQVHVYEQTLADGVEERIGDTICDTGSVRTTLKAPAKSGYIFTHWSISTTQDFVVRDRHGRAKDAVAASIYEETTFTANYLSADVDDDGDGVADGLEIYWYGSLDETPGSDTDGDGATFAEELAAGTDPVIPEIEVDGGVLWRDDGPIQYNPFGIWPYVIRSSPENVLFETFTDYIKPGTAISTPKYGGDFAYWTVNGVRQKDRHGRALDAVSVVMPAEALEIVAVCDSDEVSRSQLYWYGEEVGMDSDTDGDGATFAEELAAGTDPTIPEIDVEGGVAWRDDGLIQYNPFGLWPYVMRSNPEGSLFDTITDYIKPGTIVTTPSCGGDFAYWTVDGVRQQDRHGRALNRLSVVMPSDYMELVAVCENDEVRRSQLYWYGEEVGMDSDTDGDGTTFAEELAAGTDPTIPEIDVEGGVVWDIGDVVETDLQVYEQVTGVLVNNEFVEFFTSPMAGNEAWSETFGGDLQPIVWDLNGDGLFDMVLIYKGGYRTFINVGYRGNPEFEERKDITLEGVDLEMNNVSRLAGLALDVAAPEDALSATTNGVALLVSDSAGRIWYYQLSSPTPTQDSNYSLQHKVWGGSHAGFAEGLRLAAVDWDEDGDLDCLAGTAAGKLMLLRDPKVGRPTNLKAEAGVDTVVLTWDPNQQSRIRGYRLYRASGESEDFARIAEPQLPTYRDQPPEVATYDYKVSSVSRFYTAGNSTPTITESPATEAVRATLGGVKFDWLDVNAKVGEQVEVVISIENALNYNVAGKSQVVAYDPEYLMPVKVVKSGLTEGIELETEVSSTGQEGRWAVSMTSGVLPAGGGRFLTFVFEALKEGETTVGGAAVTIAAAPRYFLGDVDGNGELNMEDVRLLAKLKSAAGRKYTADQLKAGDFNGNGKLDEADYQALRKLLKDNRKL